jgi:hypothetical protein
VTRFALSGFFYHVTKLFGDVSVSFSCFSRRDLESDSIKLGIIAIGVTFQQCFYLRATRHTKQYGLA